ncbi:SGNH/GDSL hydrolase family protein [Actinoallomurus vinaceus]|uniref:SGNH/GDSL hydrolase family protein n=1 Tax=Actinoallomurus vinaceus TaxID=1080074 RepID=A0ABP8UFT4_9ACTN
MSQVTKVMLIAALTTAPLAASSVSAAAEPRGSRWDGAWATAVQRPFKNDWSPAWADEGFNRQSVRQVVRIGAGGSRLRIRLSNAYGAAPLHLTGASVARTGEGAAVLPGTIRSLTFRSSAAATIPVGEQLVSDPIALPVRPRERLTVTLYFQGATGPSTFHALAMEMSYRAGGDHLRDPGAGAFTESTASWYYLDGVEVTGRPGGRKRAVVAFGDSITDGYGSTAGADARYPDALAERLMAQGRARPVLNAGIAGNKVLNDSTCLGEKATARFQRDALDQPRVRTVIVLEGINDILHSETPPSPCTVPNPRVTAQELIAGYRKLIRTAHASKVRIVGATLPPFKGAYGYTERGEEVREAVNKWIRSSREYDAVVDFDRALADPADLDRIRPALDSGDHLHPNDAGYRIMAAAVDLDSL